MRSVLVVLLAILMNRWHELSELAALDLTNKNTFKTGPPREPKINIVKVSNDSSRERLHKRYQNAHLGHKL